jgi:hypothetical protein
MEKVTKAPKEIAAALLHLADSRGISVCGVYRREIGEWDYFCYNTESNKVSGCASVGTIRQEIGLGEMFELLANVKPTNRMQLTENYEAVVNYNNKTVTVGCQTIPFEKVTELYHLMAK